MNNITASDFKINYLDQSVNYLTNLGEKDKAICTFAEKILDEDTTYARSSVLFQSAFNEKEYELVQGYIKTKPKHLIDSTTKEYLLAVRKVLKNTQEYSDVIEFCFNKISGLSNHSKALKPYQIKALEWFLSYPHFQNLVYSKLMKEGDSWLVQKQVEPVLSEEARSEAEMTRILTAIFKEEQPASHYAKHPDYRKFARKLREVQVQRNERKKASRSETPDKMLERCLASTRRVFKESFAELKAFMEDRKSTLASNDISRLKLLIQVPVFKDFLQKCVEEDHGKKRKAEDHVVDTSFVKQSKLEVEEGAIQGVESVPVSEDNVVDASFVKQSKLEVEEGDEQTAESIPVLDDFDTDSFLDPAYWS